jgi:hypothetical protein
VWLSLWKKKKWKSNFRDDDTLNRDDGDCEESSSTFNNVLSLSLLSLCYLTSHFSLLSSLLSLLSQLFLLLVVSAARHKRTKEKKKMASPLSCPLCCCGRESRTVVLVPPQTAPLSREVFVILPLD